jgi:hypothetical protein
MKKKESFLKLQVTDLTLKRRWTHLIDLAQSERAPSAFWRGLKEIPPTRDPSPGEVASLKQLMQSYGLYS